MPGRRTAKAAPGSRSGEEMVVAGYGRPLAEWTNSGREAGHASPPRSHAFGLLGAARQPEIGRPLPAISIALPRSAEAIADRIECGWPARWFKYDLS